MVKCEKCEEEVFSFYKMDGDYAYHTEEYHKKDCYGHRHDNLEYIEEQWIAPEFIEEYKEYCEGKREIDEEPLTFDQFQEFNAMSSIPRNTKDVAYP